MKKNIKRLLLLCLVQISGLSVRVFAETYGEFQVEKGTPTPTPIPTTSGGSGVVSSINLPMTGEQIAVWAVLLGMLLLAFVLFLLVLRRKKEFDDARKQAEP